MGFVVRRLSRCAEGLGNRAAARGEHEARGLKPDAAFFRCLCERGLLLVNPMRGIALAESGPERIRVHLSEDEVARFLDGIDTDASFGTGRYTNSSTARPFAPAYSSADEQVLEGPDRVHDRARRRAHGRSRPRPEQRYAGLSREHGHASLGATINHHFKTLMKRAGLYREGLSVHALRHACATHLLSHGPIFATSKASWGTSQSRRRCGTPTSSWRTSAGATCEAIRGRMSREGRSMKPINRALTGLWGGLRRRQEIETAGGKRPVERKK